MMRRKMCCVFLVAIGLVAGSIGCDEAQGPGEIVVESVIGDEVRVDGDEGQTAELGQPLEVHSGQRTVEVGVGDQFSEPVEVTVEPESTTSIDIPWEALPVQHTERVDVLALDDDEIEETGRNVAEVRAGEHRAIDDRLIDRFADISTGDETPAGQPLVVERAEAMAGSYGLKLEAGDQLYAIDSQPIAELADLLDAYDGASFQDETRRVTLLRNGQKWSLDYTPTPTSEVFEDGAEPQFGGSEVSDDEIREIIGD